MTAEPPDTKRRKHVPGEAGLWLLLLGDMVVFAVFFGLLVRFRGEHADDFIAGQTNLHQTYGMFNTMVLLTSSLLVVNGVRLTRARSPLAGRMFMGAIACGVVFAVVKAIEYTELLQAGHNPSQNDFYMYYFVFTGVHLGHVVVGACGLGVAIWASRPSNASKHREATVEGVASFWHLVDLLWIMLFALLYLMR